MNKEETFKLSDVEMETLKRAASQNGKSFNSQKRDYKGSELSEYGLVREGYNHEELKALGVKPEIVTSLDEAEKSAKTKMLLDTPFGSGILKWQLPIDMMPIRVAKTIFPKNSNVDSHVHPESTQEDAGGGLRMIAKGSVIYAGKKYEAGDWFFIPNGHPYEFKTDPKSETIVFYTYRFFGAIEGNRFSHPH